MKFRFRAILTAITIIAAPTPAFAWGAEYCVNCSTEVSSLARMAKQAAQYETQLQSYALQLSQYANMVQNTVALPQEMWAQAQNDIMQVRYLANGASLMSGNSAGIIGRLQSVSGYADQAASLGNVAGQFTMWQQTIGNNLSTMGRTLGLQGQQENDNAAIEQRLEEQAQSARGQMQALEAANELAGQTNTQLFEIQSTLSNTAQMEATNEAVRADREASEDAATQQFLSGGNPAYEGNPNY